MLREGLILADRYEIIEQIGTGGMSDVYKAKCHKLNRYVAIKVLKQEFSEDKTFVTKFRAEAQSAAGLAHPNVVNVYDVGDENGIHYIVMELVEGITLKKYISKRGKIPYKEAVSIAIQVAKGMEAAHSHHIVHRDIKPQNIIISKDGKVKVTDFGIAKAATSSTINSSTMGSVHYISPEQARGGYSDERSDIYSFGITLFEMLTGRVPFDGDSTVSVAVQHIQSEVPYPSSVTSDIPISIDKIVMKCTQRKTERRYQNASELIADLKKSLVMPDEDFVKLQPVIMTQHSEVIHPIAEGKDDEIIDDELLNELDADDELLDDNDDSAEGLVDDEFSFGFGKKDNKQDSGVKKTNRPANAGTESVQKKTVSRKYTNDSDIDDEGNEKLDTVMKWLGIGIIVLIFIITAFVVVKLISTFGSINSNNNQASEQTAKQTQTKKEQTTTEDGSKITVPNVLGKTEAKAKAELNALGLGCKIVYQGSSEVEEGCVISQGTAAGSKVAVNTTIVLSVCDGPLMIKIPNVVGKTYEEASAELEKEGFKITSVKHEYSGKYEKNCVISQTPSGNTNASKGASITLVISDGEQPTSAVVTVPKVVGEKQADAVQMLEDAGFKVKITTSASASVAAGYVINQSFKAGDNIERGKEITITVSSGAGETATEPASETQTQSATDNSNTTGN